MFDPSKFAVTKARPLPVYLLLDVSGSMTESFGGADGGMTGSRIDALNEAVRTMLEQFKAMVQVETIISVGVITFGGNGAGIIQPLTPALDISWTPLSAAGWTPMGEALALAKSLIEDKNITPSNSYRPTLILVSDGEPNDSWEQPMEDLIGSGRSAKCDRMAMGITDNANVSVLEKFIRGTNHRIFTACDSNQLHSFFKKVTMTIGVRSRSQNPNDLPAASDIPSDGTSQDSATSEAAPKQYRF